MRVTTLMNRLLRLPGLNVTGVRFEQELGGAEPVLVLEIGRRFRLLTCPECGTRVRGRFEEKRRRWRHLAVLGRTTYLEGPIRRLRCPRCERVVTEEVPWARAGSVFTRPFEDAVALLAQQLSRTAVSELVSVSWVTVGRIAEWVVAEELLESRFDGLRRIGVDEICYGRQHQYLTIVVDHERGRVIWAGKGKNSETLGEFFEALGPERAARIEVVSIDMSAAYEKAVRAHAPQAKIAFDRFHVARLANDALTEVRRAEARRLDPTDAAAVKGTRWLLLKRPEKLREEEEMRLSELQRTNRALYRAYLLKESFLDVFTAPTRTAGEEHLKEWLAWASRSRLRPFVKLARTVRRHREGILTFLDTGLTNARLEGMNNKIRLLSHRAFGFHSAGPLIATIYLCCSGIELPPLHLI